MSLDKCSENTLVVHVNFHMHLCSGMHNILGMAMSVSTFVLTSQFPS